MNFIEEIIEADNASGKHQGRVHTRFPPEPNGYLHIGHAKSICLNFGVAQQYGGKTNLRFDDTNPVTEDTTYVDSIQEDVKWLGFQWEEPVRFASDYFPQLYRFAIRLIELGLAYVDDSSPDEIAAMKGTPTEAGTDSPYRNRTVEENMELFVGMKEGRFPEGSKVLRAKIDMAAANMLMRDPVIYRIKFAHHHRTGNEWCIYPMYDFAHGQSDSIEEITHSLCTLEFENHRPLYNWFIEKLGIFPSRQIEFARLSLTYTVLSKRRLLQLVNEGHVTGWDDPRMPTISGLRRRGYTPESIRNFAERVGVARRDAMLDVGLLEFSAREHLNKIALRRMAVLNPLKLVITNYPETDTENLPAENNPEDADAGFRELPFGRELYIEQDDFMIDPPKKYFRLALDATVRLKHAYIIRCTGYSTDQNGNVTGVEAEYFPESKSGSDTSGIKVKGTIHWVSANHAIKAEVRLYDRLFVTENVMGDKSVDFKSLINPDSIRVITDAMVEPDLAGVQPGDRFQFLRLGYFAPDPDSNPGSPVFNQTVSLKDSWARQNK